MATNTKINWIGAGIGIAITLGFLWMGSWVIGSGFSSGSKN